MNEPSQQSWRRWQKMKRRQVSSVEALLQSQERCCMNACSRFLNRRSLKGRVWTLTGGDGEIAALALLSRQTLLPVLCGQKHIPPPRFLSGIFGAVAIHSLQGRMDDTVIMETALEKIGLFAAENVDYDMMCIDRAPGDFESAGPAGLVIREPEATDMDALALLHGAYEREEVLPSAAEFNAAASRLNTQRLFASEQMLVAELNGRLVGKVNTNATAFTRCQVGGVYVHPDYRGLGIARRITGEFVAGLVAQGWGVSLFARKSNASARRAYQRLGFAITGDYRISYY